jgi:hypothetical protein
MNSHSNSHKIECELGLFVAWMENMLQGEDNKKYIGVIFGHFQIGEHGVAVFLLLLPQFIFMTKVVYPSVNLMVCNLSNGDVDLFRIFIFLLCFALKRTVLRNESTED